MSIMIYPWQIERESKVENLTDNELKRINIFKERAEDLAITIGKYKKIPIAKIGKDANGNVVCFETNTPDVDFILILAAKFRFFLQKRKIVISRGSLI